MVNHCVDYVDQFWWLFLCLRMVSQHMGGMVSVERKGAGIPNFKLGNSRIPGNSRFPGDCSFSRIRTGDQAGGQAPQGLEEDKEKSKLREDKYSNPKDPHGRGKGKKWSSLFGVKPLVKSGLPEVTNISDPASGQFAIFVLDKVVDMTISGLSMTLVG